MLSTEMRKASLTEYSITHYQRFLSSLSRNAKKKCSFPDHILCLNLYFRYITFRQYKLLFPLKYEKYINVSLNRLSKKGYLETLDNISNFHVYAITPAGIKYICEKLPLLLNIHYPLPEEPEYHFSVEEVLEYMKKRINIKAPAYWYHFFGIRDFYYTFLSNPLTYPEFLFLQECVIENGRPLSIYQQSLNIGKSLGTGIALRSDGMLMSRCPAYPNLDIPLFLEFDSGSQRSSVLLNKVANYVNNCRQFFQEYKKNPGLKVHMPPSIVFCMSSKYAEKKKPEPLKKYGKQKYQKCLKRAQDIYEVVSSLDVPPDIVKNSGPTLDACISLLESIEDRLSNNLTEDLIPLLLRYRNENPLDGSRPLQYIIQNLERRQIDLSNRYTQSMILYFQDYYAKRKSLLWNRVLQLEDENIKESLLLGLSVFTVSHELLQEQLPFLIPELYWYSSSLSTFLSDFGCYHGVPTITYEHLGTVNKNYILRNHYIVTDSDGSYEFFIENISDDLGGYFRIMNLLSLPGNGGLNEKCKVICIISDDFLNKHKDEITNSVLYISLMSSQTSSWRKENSELLFCTPSDFESGRYFILLSDGSRNYKTRN